MDILEVIALLSLCIACIKLGYGNQQKHKKNNRPVLRKLTVIFYNLSFEGNHLSEAPFLYL